jgi:hypothetical protein
MTAEGFTSTMSVSCSPLAVLGAPAHPLRGDKVERDSA